MLAAALSGDAGLEEDSVEAEAVEAVEAVQEEAVEEEVMEAQSKTKGKRTTTEWRIDHAVSDRCQCSFTGESIELGELRVVKTNISSNGFRMAHSYKVGPAFQMMAHMAAATIRPHSAAELLGFESIAESDQLEMTALFEWFHSLDLPSTYARATDKDLDDKG